MFWQFLGEFIAVFALGFLGIFISWSGKAYGGLIGGIIQMFNVPQYIAVVNKYKEYFGPGEWIGLAAIILVFLAVLVGLLWVIIHYSIRLYKRLFVNKQNDDDLVDEVNSNNEFINCSLETRLRFRKDGCEKAKEIFGLNIEVGTINDEEDEDASKKQPLPNNDNPPDENDLLNKKKEKIDI